ncbi:MAG: type II toxin-antitoxin system RelE/ParE family toxin [Lachnospiraceae bacterium]|nr:type II toxin-antitoxin system RelE/ParE family toxin [Lachnospiraceae bacterium]
MNKAYDISYSPEALKDLENIYCYIAFELMVPDTAENQINRIRNRIRSLDLFPDGFGQVDWEPWKSMGMRKLPVDHYIAFFLVGRDNREVIIVRILYSGMDTEGMINQ